MYGNDCNISCLWLITKYRLAFAVKAALYHHHTYPTLLYTVGWCNTSFKQLNFHKDVKVRIKLMIPPNGLFHNLQSRNCVLKNFFNVHVE